MRTLLLFALLAVIGLAMAWPTPVEDNEHPVGLLDVADAGDSHSNNGDRNARYGWGGRGGWGGGGWGHGGWGHGGWGHGGWGHGGWGHGGHGGWGWG